MTTAILAAEIGISSKAIEKHLAKLKKEVLLKRIGPDKGGHWEVGGNSYACIGRLKCMKVCKHNVISKNKL